MTLIDDIIEYRGNHIIVDCCPRNNDSSQPVEDEILEEYRFLKEMKNKNRMKYTFYLSEGLISYMMGKKGYLDIKCNECGNEYKLTKEKFKELVGEEE